MKKIFEVEIKEISTRYVQVEANDEDEARQLVTTNWHKDETYYIEYDESFDCNVETIKQINKQ
jgi:hypothetical protein